MYKEIIKTPDVEFAILASGYPIFLETVHENNKPMVSGAKNLGRHTLLVLPNIVFPRR